MGTDIHGVLQGRGRDGKWLTLCEIERSRNYKLFAVLAGVRNGRGFAGVPIFTPIKPIQENRGLPHDFEVDDDGQHSLPFGEDKVWMGDHSQGWLTLSELEAWDWVTGVENFGVVDRDVYEKWVKAGREGPPPEYSGDVSGQGVIKADERAKERPRGWNHIKAYWKETPKQECGIFWKWLGYVKAKYGYFSDLRLVFGFDS